MFAAKKKVTNLTRMLIGALDNEEVFNIELEDRGNLQLDLMNETIIILVLGHTGYENYDDRAAEEYTSLCNHRDYNHIVRPYSDTAQST
ncbi:hypothetical protein M8J77_007975 [Diaphorina citri]|nr:hypothetical protein M8J77_007975 [Diaphorina citri]